VHKFIVSIKWKHGMNEDDIKSYLHRLIDGHEMRLNRLIPVQNSLKREN
jgi:hypothetical protein